MDELIEIYSGIKERQLDEFKNMARANGAKFKDDEGDPEAFNRVLDEVNKKKGGQNKEAKKSLGVFRINNI